MRPDPRLREADLGSWEGLTRDEVHRRFPREYLAWRHGHDIRRGGGETYAEVAERAEAAIAESLTRLPEGEVMVVVTHGGTARAVIGRLLGLAPDSWRHLSSLAHGRWAVLEEAAFGWRLDEHNVRPRRRRPPI
jgi:probable phosphoglycerate mutase